MSAIVPYSYSKAKQAKSKFEFATYRPKRDTPRFELVSGNGNGKPTPADRATTAAAVGGVLVGGGGVLVAAAQATGSVLGAGAAASATAVILLAAGTALAVAGLVLVAYVGYQWLQSAGGDSSHALLYYPADAGYYAAY